MEDTYIIDFGNTNIKLLYKGTYFVYKYEQMGSIVEKAETEAVKRCFYSSVNDKSVQLLDEFDILGIEYFNCEKLLQEQNIINYDNVSNAGLDRKLGIFGAYSLHKRLPLLTIDFGTAITFNLLSEDNIYLGGSIMPGLYTQLNSLNLNTSKIKINQINFEAKFPSSNTQDALSYGILNNIISSIERIANTTNIGTIVLTGGDSKSIYPILKSTINLDKEISVFLEDFLVLKAIFQLAKDLND